MKQLDLEDAIKERDAALASVAANAGSWMERGLEAIGALPKSFTGTAEEIRLEIKVPPPHHHNAWGALIRVAVKRGLLAEIGMGQMKTKRSHARRTPLYLRTAIWQGPS